MESWHWIIPFIRLCTAQYREVFAINKEPYVTVAFCCLLGQFQEE